MKIVSFCMLAERRDSGGNYGKEKEVDASPAQGHYRICPFRSETLFLLEIRHSAGEIQDPGPPGLFNSLQSPDIL